MKSLNKMLIAMLAVLVLQACRKSEPAPEPQEEETITCPEGMVYSEILEECYNPDNIYVDPNGYQISVFNLDSMYVIYDCPYRWMETAYYVSFRGEWENQWPQNPEQLYPGGVYSEHVGIMSGMCPGPDGMTTYVNPVLGDSIIFHALVWDRVSYIRFEGRFSPDRESLTGHIDYHWHPEAIAHGYDQLGVYSMPQDLPITFERFHK